MIEALEPLPELRSRGERLFNSMAVGAADPDEVAALWRKIADLEPEPVRRAEALINLASALDYLGKAGVAQAVAVADRALKILGPKHPEAANAYLMAAQRLVRDVDSASEPDRRKALDYLHAALAVPMTARDRSVLVTLLIRYAHLAAKVGDFSKLEKARHIYGRLRKHGLPQEEVYKMFGAMVLLYQARWKANAHLPSLGKAISLSAEALALFRPGGRPEGAAELSDLRRQHAILLLERYDYNAAEKDLVTAADLLRKAVQHSGEPAIILNSLAIALGGWNSRPTTEAQFEEARQALTEGLNVAGDPRTVAHLRWTEANWHLAAYWRGGPVSHLDRAVAAAEIAAESLEILGPRPLFTLAGALYERFRAGRQQEDIDRAVETAESALGLCPTDYFDRWRHEVTAANIYQERAINNPYGFDADDAARAVDLQLAALARLPRDSPLRNDTAGTALGTLIEQYMETEDDGTRDAARQFARMLPDSPRGASKLPAIAAMNLAVFNLHLAEGPVDQAGWIAVLRNVAIKQPEDEAGWQAASNLMHLHVGNDWNAVFDAFQILARQRAARLAATRTSGERAMALRREQSVAGIAGLALVHLGRAAEAAQLIDATQAALPLQQDRDAGPGDDPAIWSTVDALFYPVATRYGAYAIAVTEQGATARMLPDFELQLPSEPGLPDASALTAASSLLEATFGGMIPERLIIVPAGELGSVPWAAVPAGPGTLVDLACLTILPTRHLWRPDLQARTETLLLVDASEALARSPLRHARAESLQLRDWIPLGEDLSGSEAQPAAVRAALPMADVVHFACHGITDSKDPMRSHLLLAGGMLSVQDVLDLDCGSLSLASLSACRSAVHGKGLPDEFASLAAAFLVAGARFAVGTLWNVHDAAASLFSRRLFAGLRDGLPPPDSVRSAQLWIRDTSDGEKARWLASLGLARTSAEEALRANLERGGDRRSFADPRHWAAFTCYG